MNPIALSLFLWLFLAIRSKAHGVLSCGLFGYVGSGRPNTHSIVLQGVFMEGRGKHSCGLYMGDTLLHGINAQAPFHVFAKEVQFPRIGKNHNVIGHTRYATVGAHTAENAHPFRIELTNYDGKKRVLYGAHNGTIKNIDDLAKKYKLDVPVGMVDSKQLYYLLINEGFKILDEYRGWAALTWCYDDEPNVLYMYHGASRELENTPLLVEERPLWILNEETGTYWASEPEVLSIMQRDKEKGQEPIKLKHNAVWRFDYSGKEPRVEKIYQVVRDNNNVGIHATGTWNNGKGGNAANFTRPKEATPSASTTNTATGKNTSLSAPTTSEKVNYLGQITYDVNTGRYFMATTGILLSGTLFITNIGSVYSGTPNAEGSVEHFYNGYLIHNHEHYNMLTKRNVGMRIGGQSSPEKEISLSIFSTYPVPFKDATGQVSWYHNKEAMNYCEFDPLWTRLNVKVVDGKATITHDDTGKFQSDVDKYITVWTEAEEDDLLPGEGKTLTSRGKSLSNGEIAQHLLEVQKAAIESNDTPDEVFPITPKQEQETQDNGAFFDTKWISLEAAYECTDHWSLNVLAVSVLEENQIKSTHGEWNTAPDEILIETLGLIQKAVTDRRTYRDIFEGYERLEELEDRMEKWINNDDMPEEVHELLTLISDTYPDIQKYGANYLGALKAGLVLSDSDADLVLEGYIEDIAEDLRSLSDKIDELDGDELPDYAKAIAVVVKGSFEVLVATIRACLEADENFADLLTTFIATLKGQQENEPKEQLQP